MNPIRDLPEGTKYVIDVFSAMTTVAALAQVLPALDSLVTVIWVKNTNVRPYMNVIEVLGNTPAIPGTPINVYQHGLEVLGDIPAPDFLRRWRANVA